MAWDYSSYLPVVTARESGGNDDAQNPNSSASGRYQFIDSTYLPLARQAYPGQSDSQLMNMKNNRDVQENIMKTFTMGNAQALQQAGIEPTNGSVYGAHFLGIGGAKRAFGADDNTPISQVVDASAIRANPAIFRGIQTAGQFKAKMNSAYGGNDAANTPSEDAVPVSANGGSGYQIPGGGRPASSPIGIVNPPSSPAKADESYKTEFLKGGPGALIGQGREDWSGSDALIGSGMALMAMSGNHQGAAALAQLMKNSKKKKPSSPWSMKNFNPETGRGLFINDQTGQVEASQLDKPYKTMSEGERKTFDESNDNIGINGGIIDKSQKYQQMIADGKIDLSLAARSKDFLNSSLDQSDEVGRNTQAFLQWRNGLANDMLRMNKGTQTDRDYANTLKELAPGLSNLDNRGTLTALDAITSKARDHLGRSIQRQNSVLDDYGENGPKGTYRDDYAALGPKFDDAEASFADKRKAYLSRQDAPTAAADSAPAPRVAPGRGGSGASGGGSFLDFMKNRRQ